MNKKIKAKDGFTLSELMMSMLIMALLMLVIGGGVVVVRNAYLRVTLRTDAQILRSTAITAVTDELRFAENIEEDTTESGPQRFGFDSPTRGYRVALENSDTQGILIANQVSGAAALPLLTDKTMNRQLIPKLDLSYDEDSRCFTVKIDIWYENQEFLTSGEPIIVMNLN